MKSLHRLVVTSTVYRQTAEIDAAKASIDPDNLLLGAWEPRRFEGEVLRDSMLAVTGELNPAMLGPPSPVIAHSDGSVTTGSDQGSKRRSVYLKVRRSQQVTILDLFDTPTMEVNCPERNVSIVPLQALAMLHAPFAELSAADLARQIVHAADTEDGRLDYACRLLYSRSPNSQERVAIRAFLSRIGKDAIGRDGNTGEQGAWTQVALVLLNSNAFVYVD
jgi:hypothetical protein